MKNFSLLICLAVFFLVSACATTDSQTNSVQFVETLEQINPRPNADLKFLLLIPETQPTDALILFAGGHGVLDLKGSKNNPKIGWGHNNFLVRSRKLFASQGFVVAVVDFPSDKRTKASLDHSVYRLSEDHITDILAVTKKLKNDYNVPVWSVGTSAGTISASWISSHIKNEVSGLVLTSSIIDATSKSDAKYPNGILGFPLKQISVPTLIVHHKADRCRFCTPSDVPKLKEALTGSPVVEVSMVSGGYADQSGPCQALSSHGFYGKERETVKIISEFIKRN